MSIVRNAVLRAVAALTLGTLAAVPTALAQTTPPTRPTSVLPTGGGAALFDPSDTVILLLDHQSGLFQTVKDISITELRNNTIMLAKLATLLKIPVITTASEPNGPNGPLMPEIHQFAPHAVYVPRKGEGPQRKHYIANTIISIEGDVANARSDYLIIRESETGLIPVMGGTYLDLFTKQDGQWRFLRKELIHDIAGDMALKNS